MYKQLVYNTFCTVQLSIYTYRNISFRGKKWVKLFQTSYLPHNNFAVTIFNINME